VRVSRRVCVCVCVGKHCASGGLGLQGCRPCGPETQQTVDEVDLTML